MSPLKKPVLLFIGALLACETMILSANSEFLVEERFEGYSEGSIINQPAAATGLDGTWQNPNGDAVVSEGVLSSEHGKSLVIAPSGKWTHIKLSPENLVPTDPGNSISIAFTMKLQTTDIENSQAFVAFTGSEPEVANSLLVGQLWAMNTFGLSHGPASTVGIDESPHTFLIVINRVGGQALEASLYIDPVDFARLPLSAQKPVSVGWPKIQQIQRIAFKANGNGFIVDDIRIASTPSLVLSDKSDGQSETETFYR